MLAIGRRVAVPVQIRRIVHLLGEHGAIVALLKLDGVRAALLGNIEHLFALLDIALMVVTDFRDHVAIRAVVDLEAVDDEFARHSYTPYAVQER